MASYRDIVVLPCVAERIAEFIASRLYVVKLLTINNDIYNGHLDLVHGLWAHMRELAKLRADLAAARALSQHGA